MSKSNTFAGMHVEHRQWESEHSMWSDDIEHWRGQYESAQSQMKTLEELVRRHGEQLDAHTQAIRRIQHSFEDHERSMAAYQRDGSDAEGQEAMCANHVQQAERQSQQREAHELLKKQHHTIMAHLMMVKAAFESAK